jgi:GTP-binding protein Era
MTAYRVGYVALIGRPNVGKSTLLNRILGQKISIISNKPQTTRISILGIHTTEKGQIIFIDNPGIHKPLHKLNKRMMNFVYSSLETADLICLLIDAAQKTGHGDEFVLETLEKVKTPVFLLINKVDIVKKENILLLIDQYQKKRNFKEIIPISALKGTNLDVLEKLIYENLPESEKLYSDDEVSDQSERFLLAEIIREKLLAHVEQELPWVTAVYIDAIEEREPGGSREAAWDEGEAEEESEEEGEAEGAGEEEAEAEEQEESEEPTSAGLTQSAREAGPEAEPETETRKPKAPAPDEIPPGVGPRPRERRPVTYIKASIFVEKDNHRKIIIGRHGQLIKLIGIEARREIEEILETKIYLDLNVKVRERWRDSADVLDLIEGQKET